MITSVQVVDISILRYLPEILAWLFGVILAVMIIRRGGGRAEKLFLAGCVLMAAAQIARPLVSELVHAGQRTFQTAMLFMQVPLLALSLAGLVCLVWAFWLYFYVRRTESP